MVLALQEKLKILPKYITAGSHIFMKKKFTVDHFHEYLHFSDKENALMVSFFFQYSLLKQIKIFTSQAITIIIIHL